MSDGGEKQPEIAEDDIRAMFDVIINSLDFGSGFLYGDEILALCRVADALGIDREAARLPAKGKEPDLGHAR